MFKFFTLNFFTYITRISHNAAGIFKMSLLALKENMHNLNSD